MLKISLDDYEPISTRNNCCYFKIKICIISFLRLVAVLIAIFIVFCLLFLCKIYIRTILLWLENQNSFIISISIMILFILVSLPISIGYIVLVVTEGYLFGIIKGLLLTIIGANFGLFIAHNILKLIGHHQSIYKYTQNQTAQAIMRVISGPLCFKIVFCSRLTPIPFGLQNTIFALSNVNTKIYHIASLLGLLPAQMVGVYAGSTLRSMQDVLENRHMSSTTYLFITIQLILAAVLMVWFSSRARTELLKALAEAEQPITKGNTTFFVV